MQGCYLIKGSSSLANPVTLTFGGTGNFLCFYFSPFYNHDPTIYYHHLFEICSRSWGCQIWLIHVHIQAIVLTHTQRSWRGRSEEQPPSHRACNAAKTVVLCDLYLISTTGSRTRRPHSLIRRLAFYNRSCDTHSRPQGCRVMRSTKWRKLRELYQ